MNAQWLLGWWNLIFIVPFFLALLYLGVYTVSGVTFGDPDVDADVDADADIHADAAHVDGDFHADMDADADLHGEVDADAAGDAPPSTVHLNTSAVTSTLAWFGVGRVPVSIMLMVCLLTWGVAGFAINNALRAGWTGTMGSVALVSAPAAAVISLVLTRIVVALVARFLPMNESTALRRHELLGSVGEAIFAIDDRFGMVSVREPGGDLHQVACRRAAQVTDRAPIPKGASVLLTGYSARRGIYVVIPHDARAGTACP